MAGGPALDTVVNSVMDSTEMKKGTARPRKKKAVPGSAYEEAQDKRLGIKETAAQERAEMKK